MEGHLQTAGTVNIALPECDPTTEGTVSVYLVYVYNDQKRRKNTALLQSNTDTKKLYFHVIDTNTDLKLFVQQFDSS